ncbi:FecCD family ABC transporter permease [Aeromicrobium choanae]|uniref:Iron complex transport system permease protein n=1 Tax=Aeromicrobium choanae TaxID=1736691 RepID=A0A1T4Z5S0_9ACTN|nr:iron ABC transporter permease [Aeromicrobium choanae]SKB09400.1 iron complex transport system permease protein [Aeromicrobium choanae]
MTLTRPRALALAFAAVVVAMVLSVAVGSHPLSPGRVWEVWWTPDATQASVAVHELRWPRTVVGLVAGAALGLAGALMQTLTRNPLADPGVLGVNAGAALAVVVASSLTGVTSVGSSLWAALVGAFLAVGVVHVLGDTGSTGGSPARIALAGVAVTAAVSAIVQTVILADQEVFNEFRFWAAGSLDGRALGTAGTILPFVVAGVALAAALAPRLNALALGDDTGRSLGLDVRRTRLLTVVAIALLCAAATAAVGPIAFVGLGVPHVARALCGSDQRWVLPCSVLLGAAFLLVADVLGRVLGGTSEVQAGIVTAILGGPVFIAVVRRRRIEAL